MNGIIVADKPAGFTSFDVIARLRGALREKKMGHGGTLDPMATGVLPLFIGCATKAADLLPVSRKRYAARVRLGIKTDTADVTGEVIGRGDASCSREALVAALGRFTGPQTQLPPMYSAVRVGGRRLYDLAREGKTVERAPRDIEIYSLELLSFDVAAGEFELDVSCSKGTYIRALAEDIAASMGRLAALSALRRTESGGFTLSDAHSLEEIIESAQAERADALLLPIERAFAPLAAVTLDDNLARLFLNGCAFEAVRLREPPPEGVRARVYHGGEFLGVGETALGKFKKLRGFRA